MLNTECKSTNFPVMLTKSKGFPKAVAAIIQQYRAVKIRNCNNSLSFSSFSMGNKSKKGKWLQNLAGKWSLLSAHLSLKTTDETISFTLVHKFPTST